MNYFKKLIVPIRGFIINYLDFFYFFLIISYKALSYNKLISGNFTGYTNSVVSSVLILVSISLLFKGKYRTSYLYILNIILTFLIVSDSVYYRYSKDIITIYTLRNGSMLGGVTGAVSSLLQLSDFIYFADIIIIIPFIFIYKKLKRSYFKILKRSLIFLLAFSIGLIVDGMTIYNLNVEQPNLVTAMFNRPYLVKELGAINFHILDAFNVESNSISNMKSLPTAKEQEIKSYLAKKDASAGTNLTGTYKGKNLIVIQVEALQQFVINQKINGKEITPNLNKWLGKSMYFDNYYYQTSAGNTSDAEFLSLNSLYPAASGAAYYMYCNDKYNSLVKNMSVEGYYTAALHGFQSGFWNRSVMYKALNFNDFYSETSYNSDDTVGMGP